MFIAFTMLYLQDSQLAIFQILRTLQIAGPPLYLLVIILIRAIQNFSGSALVHIYVFVHGCWTLPKWDILLPHELQFQN
jgi:hypothetical protein